MNDRLECFQILFTQMLVTESVAVWYLESALKELIDPSTPPKVNKCMIHDTNCDQNKPAV